MNRNVYIWTHVSHAPFIGVLLCQQVFSSGQYVLVTKKQRVDHLSFLSRSFLTAASQEIIGIQAGIVRETLVEILYISGCCDPSAGFKWRQKVHLLLWKGGQRLRGGLAQTRAME